VILLGDNVTDTVISQKESEIRDKRHARELELARYLQQDFFPATYQKKRIRIITRLIAAEELAGDYFDIFDLGPNAIGIVIGDVVGRGVPGSLMAMSVHGMIANQVGALVPPMKVLERVNGALFHQVKGDYWYSTCFYAKIHTTQLRFTYARAGHELPLWYRSESGEVRTLEGEGLPLGIFPDSTYTTRQIHLSEGDKLLLYTDGLTDTVNQAGERFGHDRLIELFQKNANLSPKNLISLIESSARKFRGRRAQLDDIAIALITVVPDSWTTITIPPFSFHEVAENLLRDLNLKGVDEDTQFKVRLSLDECVTNAYRHGHRCDERKLITVSHIVESDRVLMKVRDSGEGFDFGMIPDPTLEENLMLPGGRGVFLTMKLMDEVQFNDVGNEITLIKYLHIRNRGR
jgi:sigma-B regulation protein RsbU (phosphoserine phosphatase)